MLANAVFWPLSKLYGAGVGARNSLYDAGWLKSRTVDLPVLCIGNAVAGGSGKSPLVQFTARQLAQQGFRVAVMLRGYRGSVRDVVEVSSESETAEVGDEAQMHRRQLPSSIRIIVSPDRLAGCRFVREFDLADVVVLDDGFQHRRLQRDVNVLVIPRSSGIGLTESLASERLLPLGRLREPYRTAVARATLVASVWRSQAAIASEPATVEVEGLQRPHCSFRFSLSAWRNMWTGELVSSRQLTDGPSVACCGVAQPEQFFSMIAEEGIRPVRQFGLPDHVRYSRRICDKLFQSDCTVLTTEKDAVKLQPFLDVETRVYVAQLSVCPVGEVDQHVFANELSRVVPQIGKLPQLSESA